MEAFTVTVSQLNRYISGKFKSDENLRRLLVRGEISNFTNHIKTGHFYFTLKDGESSVRAVMFRSFAQGLRFMPENGMSVIAGGDVQVFERDGVYQLYVHDLIPDGEGALSIAFEQLKQRLSSEGLFDESHKRPLPEYPKKICLITAKTGAAVQDMINIISRRYPIAELLLIPSLVQGENAPASLCRGLALAQDSGSDVIIIGRGGGSSEDLWAFNDETLARAVYASKIPVISAVGHETDFTITDFVADLRAPTPSAAAELAVPDIAELKRQLSSAKKSACLAAQNRIASLSAQAEAANARVKLCSPVHRLKLCGERLTGLNGRALSLAMNAVELSLERLEKLSVVLSALNPENVLQRGFSITYANGKIVKSASELKSGDIIKIRLSDSEIEATVN
ncbi:MAG: exodeoxyribonuclease VII large subunit [Oscillospiraceae bacterium]